MEGFWSDPNTRDREVQGLLEAIQTHGLDSGIILTENQEEEFEVQANGRMTSIAILSVWKWVLRAPR